MTAPTTQQIDRPNYEAAVAALRAQIIAYLSAFWETATLGGETIDRLVEVVAPTVAAGQLQIANLTSVYLAEQTGSTALPVAEAVLAGRGVSAEIVYARPVVTARAEVAQGRTFVDAMRAGGRRLESLATTDLQMAKVRQADRSLAHGGHTHYRRVLKGSENCALCIIASTQRYSTGKLMPVHPGCDCDIDVISHDADFDLDANRLLEATHAQVEQFAGVAASDGRAVDYRKLIVDREHGEIGPLLAWKDQKFTALKDIKAPVKETQAEKAERLLPGFRDSLKNLRAQGLAEDSPQITYHLRQIARLEGDLTQ